MRRRLLALLVLPALASAALSKPLPEAHGHTETLRDILPRPADLEIKASAARASQEKLQQRFDQSAKRAIGSMCVECLGMNHNRPGPKTPLVLPEELSTMMGEPQVEKEP